MIFVLDNYFSRRDDLLNCSLEYFRNLIIMIAKIWRDAATLVIAVKSQANSFKILMLQRSSKSKFMVGIYFFNLLGIFYNCIRIYVQDVCVEIFYFFHLCYSLTLMFSLEVSNQKQIFHAIGILYYQNHKQII